MASRFELALALTPGDENEWRAPSGKNPGAERSAAGSGFWLPEPEPESRARPGRLPPPRLAGVRPNAVECPPLAGVAQLVERQLPKLDVVGSSPITRSNSAASAACFFGAASCDSETSRTSPAFEVMSKRRRGFPSETRVKRGIRIVHGDKELEEKLGRKDPCPCGSGQRFQAVLPP